MVIRQFVERAARRPYFKRFQKPENAFSNCARASRLLIEQAQEKGISGYLLRGEGVSEEFASEAHCREWGLMPSTVRACWCHYVAVLFTRNERLVVDFTARQFSPEAECPTVWDSEVPFRQTWHDVLRLPIIGGDD